MVNSKGFSDAPVFVLPAAKEAGPGARLGSRKLGVPAHSFQRQTNRLTVGADTRIRYKSFL
jgi:hypothetical protein